MGLLRLAVLGTPEVFHDSSRLTFALRKAQALLLYLAVEGGMHSRSKLAAFLWPDSEPHAARTALRNALVLLRSLLANPDASPAPHSHLLAEQDLLGLDPQAPFELDLDVVQHAYQQAQRLSTLPAEPQRAALVAQCQQALALVRGPFLDGFWLGEESPFDEWRAQQQQQWQVRLRLLLERLSSWQEIGGELEQATATLTHWLALDPLSEEASRRLMRVRLALGDPTAAGRVYATLRTRLAEELRVEPSPDTVALAEHIRALAARHRSSAIRASTATAESRPPGELVAPLLGRAAAFRQLVERFQQAQAGQPQNVMLQGEAGIGKTRLATEFVAWAQAQGAEVLSGHVFEAGRRLPYQPLVEALRERLEAENAPEDLLEDLWLVELARLLPELRVRYPDLPLPTEDELTAQLRLFEAVARLLDALTRRAPLVLLLEDVHWLDGASLDLLHYLGHNWKGHGSRILLLSTARREAIELNPELAAALAAAQADADAGRVPPITQITLQPLSQTETHQLLDALIGQRMPGMRSEDEQHEPGPAQPSPTRPGLLPAPTSELVGLGDVLFAHTGGQPLYLLETLKLLREREWLVPHLGADGIWRLEPTVDMTAALAQERSRHELLPPSVRAMLLARLAKLTQAAHQLVQASAVLGTQASAQLLWQLAELEVQAGVEALEEAIRSGILREEPARVGHPVRYRFAHELMREVVYTELGAARRQVLHQRALALLESEGAPAAELAYHARASGEAEAAYRYSVQAGNEALAVFVVDDAIRHYEQARGVLKEQQRLQTVLPAPEVEHLYVYLGRAYAFQNAWQQSQDVYEELFAYARQQRQPALVSMTLNRLAILAVQQANDKSKARRLLEQALHMAEISQDQKALAETEWNLAQITTAAWEEPMSGLPHGQQALSLARASNDQELEARSLSSLGWIHLRAGDFQEAMHALEAALALYAALGHEQTASQELSVAHALSDARHTQRHHHSHQTTSFHPLPSFLIGAPLTRPLRNRASEAVCWALLASAQVHAGQVHDGIHSGRRALALEQESKNVWAHITSTYCLTFGLLDAGAYEEALGLMQPTLALARTLPPTLIYQRFLMTLGSTYRAVQQWEEARSTLEEADAMAKTLDLRLFRVPTLSHLCMNCALTGEWEQAYRYAVQAIAIRKSFDRGLILLDFSPQYETEALLRGGDERQAREAVHQLGERLGSNRRFRIPYLQSLAVLAAWEGHREQAIGHLREATQLTADLGLPAEQWQIQAALGTLYEAEGKLAQAHTAFVEATTIIQGLAEGIGDETLRTRFLAGPQIHPVLQHAQGEASPVSQDQAEPCGR